MMKEKVKNREDQIDHEPGVEDITKQDEENNEECCLMNEHGCRCR